MEDVLQTGFQDISLLTEHSATSGEPDKLKERKVRSASVRTIDVKKLPHSASKQGKFLISQS